MIFQKASTNQEDHLAHMIIQHMMSIQILGVHHLDTHHMGILTRLIEMTITAILCMTHLIVPIHQLDTTIRITHHIVAAIGHPQAIHPALGHRQAIHPVIRHHVILPVLGNQEIKKSPLENGDFFYKYRWRLNHVYKTISIYQPTKIHVC